MSFRRKSPNAESLCTSLFYLPFLVGFSPGTPALGLQFTLANGCFQRKAGAEEVPLAVPSLFFFFWHMQRKEVPASSVALAAATGANCSCPGGGWLWQ